MEPIKKPKISDMVIEQIEKAIKDGQFKPGEKIPPERELLKMLNVSRNTLREALQRAETMGLIVIRHGEGIFVNTVDNISGYNSLEALYTLDSSVYREVAQARLIIETENARMAAENAKDENIHKLAKLLERMEQGSGDSKLFRYLDSEFHMEIAVATQNRIFPRFLYSISDLLRKQQEKLDEIPNIIESSKRYHSKIFAAIKDRKPVEAQQLMKEHISRVLSHTVELYDSPK